MNVISFSVYRPCHREYRGKGGGVVTTGKMDQIEVTENSLLYWSQTT